jgi:hypothetical protein
MKKLVIAAAVLAMVFYGSLAFAGSFSFATGNSVQVPVQVTDISADAWLHSNPGFHIDVDHASIQTGLSLNSSIGAAGSSGGLGNGASYAATAGGGYSQTQHSDNGYQTQSAGGGTSAAGTAGQLGVSFTFQNIGGH